jgi:hypothetical protein
MLSIAAVAQQLEPILEPVAARLAQETGWVRRRSKLTGALFVQTLVRGCPGEGVTPNAVSEDG